LDSCSGNNSRQPSGLIIVVSASRYASCLKDDAARRKLNNLTVLPFQTFESYGEVLGRGDVLIAMIEPDAALFIRYPGKFCHICAAAGLSCSLGKNAILPQPFCNVAAPAWFSVMCLLPTSSFELAALYTLQDGLPRDAEQVHGFEHFHVAIGCIFNEERTQFLRHAPIKPDEPQPIVKVSARRLRVLARRESSAAAWLGSCGIGRRRTSAAGMVLLGSRGATCATD
jgi:hypothetical protein